MTTNTERTILIVSPYFPYPATFGGCVDILGRIRLLKKYQYKITLVATVKKNPSKVEVEYIEQYIDDLILLKRKISVISILSFYPFQVSSRYSLSNYKFAKTYDYLILESEYVANILKNKTLFVYRKILRLHNIEPKYFFDLFKSSFPRIMSFYYLIDCFKFRLYSNRIYKKVDHIACISKNESDYINSKISYRKNASFSPTVIDFSELKKRNFTTKYVIYVGALFVPNNIDGLSWYIKNVHQYLIKIIPEYKFILIGSTKNNNNKKKILQMCKDDEKIDIYFNVKDLESYYRKSSVFINPTLKGAGVKIKSINAIIEGFPLVSTNKGIEGSGLKDGLHVLVSDIPSDFMKHIINLFNNQLFAKNIVHDAQDFLIKNYSETNILNTLL
jgi:hypothetical protein